MPKNFKWFALGGLAFVAILIATQPDNRPDQVVVTALPDSTESSAPTLTLNEHNKGGRAVSGYALQEKEETLLRFLLQDEEQAIAKGKTSFLAKELVVISAVDLSQALKTGGADTTLKYRDKSILLSGEISQLAPGSDKPIILSGAGGAALALGFEAADPARITALTTGQSLVVMCQSSETRQGGLQLKQCQFADVYAGKAIAALRADIDAVLRGEKAQSDLATTMSMLVISSARILPDDSPCFKNQSECFEELGRAIKDYAFGATHTKVIQELAERGVRVKLQ